MPMEYLRGLELSALPLTETNLANIDKLRVLHAAGMVEVDLPAIDAPEQRATVHVVTGLGCASLWVHGACHKTVERLRRSSLLEPTSD